MENNNNNTIIKKRIRRTKKEIEEQCKKDAKELQKLIDDGKIIDVQKKRKGKGKGKGSKVNNKEENIELTDKDIRKLKIEYLARQFPELSNIQINDLEIGIYNYVINYINKKGQICSWNPLFIGLYNHKLMSVVNNMKKYTHLIDLIINGKNKPHEIAFMNFIDIDYKNWSYLDDKKKKEEKDLAEKKLTANSHGLYTCKKCHKKDMYVTQQNTRSADEGFTNFITCVNCGFHFRTNN